MLARAIVEARSGRTAEVEPDHLLVGMGTLCGPDLPQILARGQQEPALRRSIEADAQRVTECFARAGISPHRLRRSLRAALAVEGGAGGGERQLSRTARRAFRRATELAGPEKADAVRLLRAVLDELTPVGHNVLTSHGISDAPAALFPVAPDTPHLDLYGRDLSALARAGKLPALIGRGAEPRTLARILVRRRKANAVLVGHAGTGKTGIVQGLAQRLASPAELAGARIVELSMSALVAGTKYRGEFEERIQAVLDEARAAPEVILFIDELHTVLRAGGRGASDAANILKPALARGELRCIGATTPGEHRRDIEDDPALQRRFEVVWVDEPDRDEAVAILTGVAESFMAHHGVRIEPGAVAAAVDLTIRHLPDQRLPDKAIDALDHACAASRIRTLSPDAAPEPALRIGRDEVAAVVAERARLPLQQVARGEAERLLAMEEQLRRRVVGQEEAVRAVAEAVRTGREGAPPAGPGPADPAHRPILDALRQYFRPELLGRIGRIVVFSPLSEADLRPILDRILDRVHARLATRAITLTLTPAGRALLLRHGTDRRAGARFLEQAVDRLLVQPLARALLTGDIPDGSTVRVDAAVRRCP
ncbi:AAA family ATPase [Streptomyces sp. NPDC054865]